jgi:phosphoribosyl 1,2-cyclic phosphate phosphodiesterase
MQALQVTLLGTGTSTGIPVIGFRCRVCRSQAPRETRLRCAAYLRAETPTGSVHILIDAGPDLRQQALAHNLTRIDAVLITHHHFDHVAGLDDLRPFCFDNRTRIPIYAQETTAEVLERALPYLFRDDSYPGVARLSLHVVGEPLHVQSRNHPGAIPVQPLEAQHGRLPVLGFRVGDFAYLTDVKEIPEATRKKLDGVSVLVLDALRREPHASHFSLDEAVAAARAIGARQTYFVHMTHSVLHAEEERRLPEGMALAYDGLTVVLENEVA